MIEFGRVGTFFVPTRLSVRCKGASSRKQSYPRGHKRRAHPSMMRLKSS